LFKANVIFYLNLRDDGEDLLSGVDLHLALLFVMIMYQVFCDDLLDRAGARCSGLNWKSSYLILECEALRIGKCVSRVNSMRCNPASVDLMLFFIIYRIRE